MTYLFAALGLIIVIMVLYKMFSTDTTRSSETQPAEDNVADTSEDEYLYDPKTGKRITLEEAIHGYEVEQEEQDKPDADKAAEQKLSEEEVAVMRIRNWMILENFGLVTETEASTLLSSLHNSTLLQAYGSKMEYLFSAAPDTGLLLMVMQMHPSMGHRREGGELGEHQLLGLLKLEYFEGKAVLIPRSAQDTLTVNFGAAQEFTTDKHTILLADKDNLPEALLRLDVALAGLTNYVAEVHQQYLLIKSNQPATAEEADDLLQCLQAVKRALND